MRTLTLLFVVLVTGRSVCGSGNGTESVTSVEFGGDKSEIEFGRSVAEEFKSRLDDAYYEYEDDENEVSGRSEKESTTSGPSGIDEETKGVPTEVFLTMRNLTEEGENFRTFKKRNDVTDLQASASDNVAVNVTGNATEQGWNSRAYRDARYPIELSLVPDEPLQHVLLPYQHTKIDTADLSDCARQGEWRPIGEIHIDSSQQNLQQEHDYLIPAGSHDAYRGGFGDHATLHSIYHDRPAQGSFAEFQKLTADAASAQSTRGVLDFQQHLQKYVPGTVSSYAPAFGNGVLSYSSDYGSFPTNHKLPGHGEQGTGYKFYHGQGNVLVGGGAKLKQPGLGSYGSGSFGSGQFLKKPGAHGVRYAPGGFSFNRKPGPSAFGDGSGGGLPPFLRGKKPGGVWKQKVKSGGFRRPNFDALKSGPHLDAGFFAGGDSSGGYSGGYGGSSSYLGGYGSSGALHAGSPSVAFLRGHGNSGSSAAFHGGHGGSGSSGAIYGGSGSSGIVVGSYGGSGDSLHDGSAGVLGSHGSSGSSSGSFSSGHGSSGSSGAFLGSYGDSAITSGGSSLGGIISGYGGHKGIVEGGSLADNTLLSGHAENVALASALTDQNYQNVGHITHEAILQDASQLTSFTCGKNHDHGTNYHTASFQVSDDDHGSQDVLQYEDGGHVIIHAANNGFDDVIHAERKQSEDGGEGKKDGETEASNHRYAEGGDEGTTDQVEESSSHSYYREKSESSPLHFDKPQIVKELEELSSRFQLENGKSNGFFSDEEKPNTITHSGFSIVHVNDSPKDDRYRYEEYSNDGDVITEYPYYSVHSEGPGSLPVVITEHHPPKEEKPKAHIPPKRKNPGKQYEVHENSGEKHVPTTEIFPPQKFPRQFHNPMPNLAGRPPKDSSKYFHPPSYTSYPYHPTSKKIKKYIPGKVKYRRPIIMRRPIPPIPITAAPIVRVSVSS